MFESCLLRRIRDPFVGITIKPPLNTTCIYKKTPPFNDHHLKYPRAHFDVVEPEYNDHLCIKTHFDGHRWLLYCSVRNQYRVGFLFTCIIFPKDHRREFTKPIQTIERFSFLSGMVSCLRLIHLRMSMMLYN